MTVRCALALGEVPWERDVLDAAERDCNVILARRYVDAEEVLRDRAAPPEVLIASPALRGFSLKSLSAIGALGVRIIIIVDTIRPTWLADAGFTLVERAALDVEALFAGLTTQGPTQRRRGVRTVFVGTGGGVGTTTLACAYAGHVPGARFVEADASRSSAALLLGPDHPGVHPLSAQGTRDLVPTALQDEAHPVVLDGGVLQDACTWIDDMRLVLVTPATPLGIVRVCSAAETHSAHAAGLIIVLNRVRSSAVGSNRGGAAMRALVERATGIDPILIPDRTDLCDAAWLRGDVRLLRELAVPLLADRAQHNQAA